MNKDSSAVPQEVVAIQFGVELELVLQKFGFPISSWDSLVQTVEKDCREKGLTCHTGRRDPEDYSEWILEFDHSIRAIHPSYGVEFISRTFPFSLDAIWLSDLNILWTILETEYQTTVDTSCGTHVHISPLEPWKLEQVKKVAAAVVFFETTVDQLMPADRVEGNDYLLSNRNNDRLKDLGMLQIFNEIKGAEDTNASIELVCPNNFDLFRWNFWSIVNDKGVEFRQAPASANAIETRKWAEFGVSFVAACFSKVQLDPAKSPEIEDLKAFVLRGASLVGLDDYTRLNGLFLDGNGEAATT